MKILDRISIFALGVYVCVYFCAYVTTCEYMGGAGA